MRGVFFGGLRHCVHPIVPAPPHCCPQLCPGRGRAPATAFSSCLCLGGCGLLLMAVAMSSSVLLVATDLCLSLVSRFGAVCLHVAVAVFVPDLQCHAVGAACSPNHVARLVWWSLSSRPWCIPSLLLPSPEPPDGDPSASTVPSGPSSQGVFGNHTLSHPSAVLPVQTPGLGLRGPPPWPGPG